MRVDPDLWPSWSLMFPSEGSGSSQWAVQELHADRGIHPDSSHQVETLQQGCYQCFLWACISSLKTQVYLCHNIELFLDSEVRLRREFPNNHSVSSLALQDRNTMQRSCAIKPTSDTRETPPTAPACWTGGRQQSPRAH